MLKKFITALLLTVNTATNIFAQAPGGVSGAELWFKTIPVSSADLQDKYRWADFSGDSVSFIQYNRYSTPHSAEFTQWRSAIHTFNFHPALMFSDANISKEAVLRRSNLAQSTVIGVFAPELSGYASDMTVYGINSRRRGEGAALTKDKLLRASGIEPIDYGSAEGEDLIHKSSDTISPERFKETALRVVTYMKANKPNTSVWGEKKESVITIGSAYSEANPEFNNTNFGSSQPGGARFGGYIPELIIYGRYLTPGERRRVESYLAMKYGITLTGSYLDGDGNLIWDIDDNTRFHNRVTAIGMDITAGLRQPVSATSYEESPEYSASPDNDSYHASNSYALPSSSHLLVMGREYGNSIPDKSYAIWGDDNSPTETYTSSTDPLWHIMSRTWLVRSNMPAVADSAMTRWNGNGLDVSRSGFTDSISMKDAAAEAYAITPAFADSCASIEFTCPSVIPTFDVGLSISGGSTCAYGFRINSNGTVSAINGGNVSTLQKAPNVLGSTISIRMENNSIALRINGTGDSKYTMAVPAGESYSGIIRTASADTPLTLADVRTGGIGDTGCQAELSYNLTNGKEFAQYKRRRTVMLIDPTGEGDFSEDNIIMSICSKPDLTRGKTMFHNIFWDTDGSGSDAFTFAYYDGLSAELTEYPSTCNGNEPKNDGALDINIVFGTPLYSYSLSVDDVEGKTNGDIAASGIFCKDSHRIGSLAPGTYTLQLTQGGGSDIYGTGNSMYAAYARDKETYRNGEISWTITGTDSNVRIGANTSYYQDESIRYGFSITGQTAYIIKNGQTATTDGITVKPGDVFSLSFNETTVTYTLNGVEIHRTGNTSPYRQWRMLVRFGIGETHITGLTVNGESVHDFDTYGNVEVENTIQHTITKTVNIYSECDNSMPNRVKDGTKRAKGSTASTAAISTQSTVFSVSATNTSERSFDAKLTQDSPTAATLMVFDASGKLLTETQMEGTSVKNARFNVPSPGVYVVKAITEKDEHTRKIVAK